MIKRQCVLLLFALSFSFHFLANAGSDYPVIVLGEDSQEIPPATGEPILQNFDFVVVGGGLAGLTAALYLSDSGKKVVLLEKAESLGGVAAGGSEDGVSYDRGAAYWTGTYEEEQKILDRVGYTNLSENKIPEPADSYLLNGVLYKGIWDESLDYLPASFALFKNEFKKNYKANLIPNQPMEECEKYGYNLDLDKISAADLIQRMPSTAKKRKDPKSKKIYQRFLEDPRVDPNDPMKDVLALMNLYSRSALGATADKISGLAFSNFYISEMETRYTTQSGTNGVAESIIKRLKKAQVTALTSAPVSRIENANNGVEVTYSKDNQKYLIKASYVVFGAQIKFAPKIIADFAAKSPEQNELINKLEVTHYSVHNAFVEGHPYRATYDTWFTPNDGKPTPFTDIILGRWMDPKINGYLGMRNFEKDPDDDKGIFSIYHPLDVSSVQRSYDVEMAEKIARQDVARMIDIFSELPDSTAKEIKVNKVITTRWPYSIHIVKPGHFNPATARVMRKPFGRVYFAHSNLGTPAFEEALFRGHCAADNIMLKAVPKFKFEKWTRCPRED